LAEARSWKAKLADWKVRRAPPKKSVLLHPCTTALNQNYEHDHEEHTGNNADNCYIVHSLVLLLLRASSKMLLSGLGVSAQAVPFPASEMWVRASFEELRSKDALAGGIRPLLRGHQPIRQYRELLYVSATALNQHSQHDHKKHAGDNPDHRDTVHLRVSLLSIA
jgi:hypothetical protein